MEYFCPSFLCKLEGEELYLPLTVGSDLFCLSFEGLAGWDLQICLDNWVYKFYFQPILSPWAKPDASLGKDVNLGVGELWLFFSALLRLLWKDQGYSLGHRLCRSASSLDGKTACAIKGGNKLMSCRQSVQSTALCVPGGVSLRHSVCTALAGKIPFPYFFLLTCSRVLAGKDLLISLVLLPFQFE